MAFLYALTLAKVTANLIVNLQLVLSDSDLLASLPLIRGAIYIGFVQLSTTAASPGSSWTPCPGAIPLPEGFGAISIRNAGLCLEID